MPALTSEMLAALAREGVVSPVARRGLIRLDLPTVTLVVSGWFRVFRDAAFVRDVSLVLAGPGDVLAPGSVFGDRSGETGAQALTDGRVLVVAAAAVEAYAEAHPAVYAEIARSLARRALTVQRKLEAVSRSTAEARVAAALLEVAAVAGAAAGNRAIRLDLPLSQEDLAALAATTRETCSSVVAAFARRGFVRGSRLRGLLLLDPDALADIAAVDFRHP